VEVPQKFVPRTLVLPLQELVLAAEGEVPAVYSDVAVSVVGSRVGVQPLLVSEIRRPSVLDAPCVAIISARRIILRALAQAAVEGLSGGPSPAVEVVAWVAIPSAFGSLLLPPAALPCGSGEEYCHSLS